MIPKTNIHTHISSFSADPRTIFALDQNSPVSLTLHVSRSRQIWTLLPQRQWTDATNRTGQSPSRRVQFEFLPAIGLNIA
jgi:hypothetical protein